MEFWCRRAIGICTWPITTITISEPRDGWRRVVELKDVSPGYELSRINIFKSNGLGIEDVAAAAFVM
jgi:ornithine cyclodeaminase/alanine dehydrogenase-like protein (mu-crystallin family)